LASPYIYAVACNAAATATDNTGIKKNIFPENITPLNKWRVLYSFLTQKTTLQLYSQNARERQISLDFSLWPYRSHNRPILELNAGKSDNKSIVPQSSGKAG
jgi:hypothetical protein